MNRIHLIIFSSFFCVQLFAQSEKTLVKNHLGKEVPGRVSILRFASGEIDEKSETFPFICNGKKEDIIAKSESYYESGALKSKVYLMRNGTRGYVVEEYREPENRGTTMKYDGIMKKKSVYSDFCMFSWKEYEYDEFGGLVKTTTLINGVVKNVRVGNKDYKPNVVVDKGQDRSTTKKASAQIKDEMEEGNKFCLDDSYNSGNKFELVLVDGGRAKLVIKNSDNKIIRRGEGNWSGKNDGPGGNTPIITLRLSTGVLSFSAIVDQYSSSISMLIDSRKNQWLKCY